MLRAGYGLQGNPYQEKMDDNGRVLTNFKEQFKIQTYSGGLGYRINDVYFDLTYQQISYNTQISPYSLNDATNPVANIDNKRNNIFLTIGKRF
jgi:predicted porin